MLEFFSHISLSSLLQQILVGLSRTTILFIVASGLSLVWGCFAYRIWRMAHFI